MADLDPRQWELAGLVFGDRTQIRVTDFVPGGKPDAEVQDQRRPRSDGIMFGRDTVGGQLITFELTVDTQTADDARAQWGLLADAWDAARDTPGAAAPLRVHAAGTETRRVFGRPRKLEPASVRLLDAGRVDLVADFQARDGLFYSDVEHSITLDQIPPTSTGLVAPLVAPISTEPFGSRDGFVTNAGQAATPVRIRFNGPCSRPSLTLVGSGEVLALDLTLVTNEHVEIDTWDRTVLRGGVANVAGTLTRSSRFWRLPSGTSELRYQAVDPTATSNAQVFWRDAYYSL